MSEADALDDDCIECSEDDAAQCPRSVKPCGHHCNHVWTHDACCYCGWLVPNDDDPGGVREPRLPVGPGPLTLPAAPPRDDPTAAIRKLREEGQRLVEAYRRLHAPVDPAEAPQRPEKRPTA